MYVDVNEFVCLHIDLQFAIDYEKVKKNKKQNEKSIKKAKYENCIAGLKFFLDFCLFSRIDCHPTVIL